MKRTRSTSAGFTVIEMMVSVALFAIVMVVSAGALLSLAHANRKAQALQSVMNNLSTTLDSMVRSMREGSTFHCGTGNYTLPQDCTSGNTTFSFEPNGGTASANDQRVYNYVPPSGTNKGYIQRSLNGGSTWMRVTAPEISITDMKFYVVGTTPGDTVQPKAMIEIKGVAGGSDNRIKTTFHIQATAVQRVLDL